MHSVQIVNGRWHLQLHNAPEFCHSLASAPSAKEEKLNEGLWLILVFAVWSSPDRQAIENAVSAVKTFSGRIQLGIRPMDEYGETAVWCPEAKNNRKTPLWLVLRDGVLVDDLAGIMTQTELATRIQPFVNEMLAPGKCAVDGYLPDPGIASLDSGSESRA